VLLDAIVDCQPNPTLTLLPIYKKKNNNNGSNGLGGWGNRGLDFQSTIADNRSEIAPQQIGQQIMTETE
jgi:hypothetical protein